MTDQTEKLLIIPKHMTQKNGKLKRRCFHEENELDEILELAQSYATEKKQDYLIVKVVAETSKPKAE